MIKYIYNTLVAIYFIALAAILGIIYALPVMILAWDVRAADGIYETLNNIVEDLMI